MSPNGILITMTITLRMREVVTLLILWCSMSKTQSFIVLVVISVFCSGDLTLTKGQRRTFKEVTVSRDLNKSMIQSLHVREERVEKEIG